MTDASKGMFGGLGRRLPSPLRDLAIKTVNLGFFSYGRVRGQLERGGSGGAPVCVMGMHRSILGLGRGARLFRAALINDGIECSAWDVSSRYGNGNSNLPLEAGDPRLARSVIAHINPVEHVHAIALDPGLRPKSGFRVGYWAWETSVPPKSWRQGFDVIDEVWCPSQFTARAIESFAPARVNVRTVPHPWFETLGKPDRARFGFDVDKIVLLTACDMNSSLARKNPSGAIEAFARSRCGENGRAELVIKIHGANPESQAFRALAEQAEKVKGVRFLTERLDEVGMADLMASIDILLSPHRSEGFGLVLAEAMAAGVPVIATGWSGNMDFMTPDSAALIAAREVPVFDPQGIYKEGIWAEPDIDHAALLIEKLVDDPEELRALGERGKAQWQRFSERDKWNQQVRSLLNIS